MVFHYEERNKVHIIREQTLTRTLSEPFPLSFTTGAPSARGLHGRPTVSQHNTTQSKRLFKMTRSVGLTLTYTPLPTASRTGAHRFAQPLPPSIASPQNGNKTHKKNYREQSTPGGARGATRLGTAVGVKGGFATTFRDGCDTAVEKKKKITWGRAVVIERLLDTAFRAHAACTRLKTKRCEPLCFDSRPN